MNIPAAQLKSLLKKLSAVRTEMVLLDTAQGTLFAADNDLRLWVSSPLLKDDSGRILQINGRRLSSAVTRLSGAVSLVPSEKSLAVSSAKTRFTLEATAAKAVPVEFEGKVFSPLPAAAVKSLLKAGTVVTQKGHASFSDIVELQGDKVLRVRATNELRLAVNWGEAYEGEPFQHLIPVSAVNALQELPGDTIGMRVEDALVLFTNWGDADVRVVIAARRSAKQFPNFDAILPKTFAHTVKVDAAAMREGLARISPFVMSDDKKTIAVTFPGTDIQLAARHGGEAVDLIPQIDAPSTEDDPFGETPAGQYKLYLNHTYLSDFFAAAEGEVSIGINGNQKPVWLDGGKVNVLLTVQVPA